MKPAVWDAGQRLWERGYGTAPAPMRRFACLLVLRACRRSARAFCSLRVSLGWRGSGSNACAISTFEDGPLARTVKVQRISISSGHGGRLRPTSSQPEMKGAAAAVLTPDRTDSPEPEVSGTRWSSRTSSADELDHVTDVGNFAPEVSRARPISVT